ncbi:MAG: response regulator [Bacteroidales bacterium]
MDRRTDRPPLGFNWRGKKILIVEDDYANYLFFHEMLADAQACLIRAVSLQEAYDMLSEVTRFDLLLINNSIPGNENCRSIKKMKLLWPGLRIIAISGCESQERHTRCYPCGCDAVIDHHVDSYEMLTLVNDMFYSVS